MDSGSQAWSYMNSDVDPSLFSSPFSAAVTSLNDPYMSYDYQLSLQANMNMSMGEPDQTSGKLSATLKELSSEPRTITFSSPSKIKSPEAPSFPLPPLAFSNDSHNASGSTLATEPARTLGLIPSPSAAEKAEKLEREKDPSGVFERAAIKQDPRKWATKLFPHAHQSDLRDRSFDIFHSDWWLTNDREPHGVLHPFIERQGAKAFKCKSCAKKLTRVDRAVDHFRTHIHHRPYTCQGKASCGDVLCKYAFYTKDCLKSHCSKHEKLCERCGTKVEDKNLSRHQATRKCNRYSVY